MDANCVRSSPQRSIVCSEVYQFDEMYKLDLSVTLKILKNTSNLDEWICVQSWFTDFWFRRCFRKIEEALCRKRIPKIRWSFSFPSWQTIWRYEKVHIYLSVDISHHGMIILTLSTFPQRDNKPYLGCNWSLTIKSEKNWC